jgi:DNA-binding Lrp family transcriptional regulator
LSIKVIQWVWDCSQSKNAERLVLLAIADNAADDGSHAYPSLAELQRKANLSERAVRDALRRLEAAGELKTHIGGGRGGTNYYTVIMTPCDRRNPADSAPAKTRNPEESAGGEGQNLPGGGADSAPGTVPEPSPEPSSSFDAKASPTAQTILKSFIDWLGLPAQGSVKLSSRAIGIYAKTLKELLGEGFDEGLLKRALAAMHERGLTGRPTLLHSFVVEVQASRPTSGAPKPFVQQADEYKATKTDREDKILQLMQDLMDYAEREHGQVLDVSKARKMISGWVEAGQIDLNSLSVSVPSLYSGHNVIATDAEEVS